MVETEAWRREKLLGAIELPKLPCHNSQVLQQFLADYHDVFSLEEGEGGKTDLVCMEVNTGDNSPKKQPPRRMSFAVRQDVAKQLKNMHKNGVIQPSCLPWSSPVVMVRKKGRSHRLCVDYRGLNAVTRPDTFPLPPMHDLLDQLSKARYFLILDLTSGFWQIWMEPLSK